MSQDDVAHINNGECQQSGAFSHISRQTRPAYGGNDFTVRDVACSVSTAACQYLLLTVRRVSCGQLHQIRSQLLLGGQCKSAVEQTTPSQGQGDNGRMNRKGTTAAYAWRRNKVAVPERKGLAGRVTKGHGYGDITVLEARFSQCSLGQREGHG